GAHGGRPRRPARVRRAVRGWRRVGGSRRRPRRAAARRGRRGTGRGSRCRAVRRSRGRAVTDAPTGVPAAYLRLRDDAHRLLSGWEAPDDQQEQLRTELLAHCATHPDAMWKQGPPAHLTASALVLGPSLDTVLLTL